MALQCSCALLRVAATLRSSFSSISWAQLARSMERATDFDQSHLFELVYSREFGMPGGEPYRAAYRRLPAFSDWPRQWRNGQHADRAWHGSRSRLLPFHRRCLARRHRAREFRRVEPGARSVGAGERPVAHSLEQPEGTGGFPLSRSCCAPYSVRSPYEPYSRRRDDGFPFREDVSADGGTLLWCNGAFAFATIVIRNFMESGWFADIRGVTQDAIDGGLLSAAELAPYDFGTESDGLSAQAPVEVRLTSAQEQQFCDLGLIPIATTYLSGLGDLQLEPVAACAAALFE